MWKTLISWERRVRRWIEWVISTLYCLYDDIYSIRTNKWSNLKRYGRERRLFWEDDQISPFWRNFSFYLADTSQVIHTTFISFLYYPLSIPFLRYIRLDVVHSPDFWMSTVGDVWPVARFSVFSFQSEKCSEKSCFWSYLTIYKSFLGDR